MTRPTGEDAMSNEHVEVLRDLSEVCRAAIKAGDWKVDGACDPDSLLRHADAAIAALSAPQPPAEAQLYSEEYSDAENVAPSAPVGVAADILRIVDTAIDVCNDRDRPAMAEDLEAVRLYVEQASAPLAQQPAAVDEADKGGDA